MKHKFVLDVNTIIFAQDFCDAKGNRDFAPAALIVSIAQNCHKIVCDNSLKKKYLQNLKDDRFAKLMKHLLFNAEKCEDHNYLPDYPFEKKLPSDDVNIVKLAVFAQATFVTSDSRLQAKIQELQITENYGLKIEDPKKAQILAQRVNS